MGMFIEKNLGGNSRKAIGRKMNRAGVFDIPSNLHTLKTESIENLDIDELEEVQN